MDKVIVFGASPDDKKMHSLIKEKYNIIAFTDNDETKWGGEIENIKIIPPAEILSLKYNQIIILSITGLYAIRDQLISYGVDKNLINLSYMEFRLKAREQFLVDFARVVYDNKINGAVAEAGVYRGEFAKVINKNFPDRKLYLFDTFEGFDSKDISYEEQYSFSNARTGRFNMTSEDLVMKMMKYPENCIVKKGHFPETAADIDDRFCFVNLDMDLYKPTLEGLKYFWEKMEIGGIILVHDYLAEVYQGIKSAVDQFMEKERNVQLFPIGDSMSIGIIKIFG